jgi:hypothetical protein
LHVERAVVAAGNDVGQEFVVWNRDRVVIECLHAHRAQPDGRDVAILPAKGDAVSDLKRTVDHHHDAGNEGGDKVANCKTHSQGKRTTDQRDDLVIELNAQCDHGNRHRDVDDELHERRDFLEKHALVRKLISKPIDG